MLSSGGHRSGRATGSKALCPTDGCRRYNHVRKLSLRGAVKALPDSCSAYSPCGHSCTGMNVLQTDSESKTKKILQTCFGRSSGSSSHMNSGAFMVELSLNLPSTFPEQEDSAGPARERGLLPVGCSGQRVAHQEAPPRRSGCLQPTHYIRLLS